MRKLIYQVWTTLDGFAADAKGTTSFFESPGMNEGSDDDLVKDMEHIDTILMGKNTYKTFVDYWPEATVDQEPIADQLNSTERIVFSSTLENAPWGKWEPVRIVTGDAAEEIKKLKAQQGNNIVLWGSISLAQSLMKENLIDEYHVRICPLTLGEGKPLFNKDSKLKLQLIHTKTYPSGLTLLQYKSNK